jgi:hypothetical protein
MNTSKFSALALPTSPGGANWAGHGPPSRNSQAADARPNLPQRRERAHVPCLGVYSERVVASAAFTFTLAAFTQPLRRGRARARSERTKIDEREDAS